MNKHVTKEEIKELAKVIRLACIQTTDYDCEMSGLDCAECKATAVYEAGWRKSIEAEWIPIDRYLEILKCYAVIGYTCSNCKTKVEEYTNYCAYCGAHMEVRDK